ncbi:hypothetical protein DNHGIG_05990 [Collibacillus ludicampi]|uniref:2'-5' RNA ligase family protein n=1 Tax=Collibacillus ludicampi TaxID=2771369 RepID=A0AAV4LB93_9BACL|nr:2'-5' RNA ligase family protein [Collibacillus ludicampi]GIM45050.1 hypothetical protein DNHGIG_05990 [Collibacillus ludicampi]
MKYFLGFVPPEEIYKRIEDFRKRTNERHFRHIEAHITVKSPEYLGDPKLWMPMLKETCERQEPVEIQLGSPMFFGRSAVLYLSIHSERILSFHKAVLACLRPFCPPQDRRRFEGDDYHPHLTIAMKSFGLKEHEMQQAFILAAEQLSGFPPFHAKSVRVYQQLEKGHPWKPLYDIPLGH